MEQMKENNTPIENRRQTPPLSNNNSEPDFQITRKGWLFIAVIVMYVAAIGMPFIGNRFGSDFFEMRASLGYMVLLMIDSMGHAYQFANILELVAAIALFVLPLFYFLISGSDEDLRYSRPIAIIQLGCIFYFSRSWFIDNTFVSMSWGFYFYLIATIVALCIGLKESDDTTYFMNFCKDVFEKIKNSCFFQWADEQERKLFPTIANEKCHAGNVLLGTIVFGLITALIYNPYKDEGDASVIKVLYVCTFVIILCIILSYSLSKDAPWLDKLRHIIVLLMVCSIGFFLGYYPLILMIALIIYSVIGWKK